MSYIHTIQKLNNSQNFVGLLHRRMQKLSRSLGIELEYNDQVARQIAQQWRRLLASEFNFAEAEFELLIDEVVGELICIIATTKTLVKPVAKMPPDPLIRAVVTYVHEYIALDVAVEIVRRVLKGQFILKSPTPQQILQAALMLRQQPHMAHNYWTWLGLKAFDA